MEQVTDEQQTETDAATTADSGVPAQQPVKQQSQPTSATTPQAASQTQQSSRNTAATPSAPQAQTPQRSNALQHASILREIAETLAGGPRYQTIINPVTGATTHTPVPMGKTDIGMAIALAAISGGLSGLSQNGPGATGRAGALGFQTGQQLAAQKQQAQQKQDQQATADYNMLGEATLHAATVADINSRALLNTAQTERYGVENLKDAVATNADLLRGYQDADAIDESHVPQDVLLDGLMNGKYNSTKQIAIPDGFVNVDGRYEQTFSVVKNPAAKVILTNEQAQEFANAGVAGWEQFRNGQSRMSDDGVMVPGTYIAKAKAQVVANGLMVQEAHSIADALANSPDAINRELAKGMPDFKKLVSDPQSGPSLQVALSKMQKYVSHVGLTHNDDFAESLQRMAAPTKADPLNPKQTINNPDAPFANQIVSAIGGGNTEKGWKILQRYSQEVTPDPIKSTSDAESLVANNSPNSKAYRTGQKFLALDRQQKANVAAAEAQAREAAKPQAAPAPTSPDALGFTPSVTNAKEANTRFHGFKKNLDDLNRTEQSYAQFQAALADINAGKWTGADSVVSLFNAIGLSATPLAGRGFRVNNNVINEHAGARGWEGALQAKLQGVQSGAIITPQQLKDYAGIAAQARTQQIVGTVNEMHDSGINADAALPTGNGRKLDAASAQAFLTLAGNDAGKARKAAAAKGWTF